MIAITSGGAGDVVSRGAAGASLSVSPRYSSGSSKKSGRVSPVDNKSPPAYHRDSLGACNIALPGTACSPRVITVEVQDTSNLIALN